MQVNLGQSNIYMQSAKNNTLGWDNSMTNWDNNWITLGQAATLLQCSKKTLYRRMQSQHLDYKLGENNRRYINKESLERLHPTKEAPLPISSLDTNSWYQLIDLQQKQLEILRDVIVFLKPEEVKDISLKQFWLDRLRDISTQIEDIKY